MAIHIPTRSLDRSWAFYTGKDYIDVCEKVCTILHYEGAGHTFSMHTKDDKMVDYFAKRVPASRIMVNTPSALGGIGAIHGTFSRHLTLGCGASAEVLPLKT